MSYKYVYKLFDSSKNTYEEMYQGNVFSKEKAESWVKHNVLGSYHELLICKLYDEPCSQYCDLNIKQETKNQQGGPADVRGQTLQPQ